MWFTKEEGGDPICDEGGDEPISFFFSLYYGSGGFSVEVRCIQYSYLNEIRSLLSFNW